MFIPYLRGGQYIDRVAAFLGFFVGISVPLRASGVATQQAAMGLALVAVFVLISVSPDARSRARDAILSPVGAAVALLFTVWGVTLFGSFDPFASFKVYARTGAFIVGAVLIWAALCTYTSAQGLMWKALILSSLILTALALLSINGMPLILSALKGRMLENEVPRQAFKAFAATTMCLIPVVVWAGGKLGGAWSRAVYIFVPMALIVMVQTSNRAALAGTLLMAMVFTAWLVAKHKKHAVVILLVAVGFTAAILSWIVFSELHSGETIIAEQLYLPEWLVDQHRQHIWRFVFERYLEHPWLGNGIDQINKLSGANLKIPYMFGYAPWVPSHPHNWALEVLAETGVVGLGCLILALSMTTWQTFRRYQATHDGKFIVLIVFMAGFWFSALFNFSVWATWWQLTFVVLFAMVASTHEEESLPS